MSKTETKPIIIKRPKRATATTHSGSWKIAYADFMTAMMAFFLLMWLLSSIDNKTLNGIAEYFKISLQTSLTGSPRSSNSAIILEDNSKDATAEGALQKLKPMTDEEIQKAAKEAKEIAELSMMHALKTKLDRMIQSNAKLRPYKNQLLIEITSEGLRIQIVDEKNRPMFDLSSAELKPYTRDILHEIAPSLNDLPNRISLSGHTDAKLYASGGKNYSNWELSADRANAARRVLVAGGLEENRLIRVIGLSSAVLLDSKDPLNPINRRISIILLNQRAEDAAMKEGQRSVIDLTTLPK